MLSATERKSLQLKQVLAGRRKLLKYKNNKIIEIHFLYINFFMPKISQ
jgi:hypothetical protein